jgi:chemotaxis regulatin CheY-phosphate phosphatase CheZ
MENNSKSLTKVFENLNSLKSAFKIGEKVVPIIQNLTEFMQEIIPLLNRINSSIVESAGKMPEAKDQINSVTSATELATTEILDLVDEITAEVNSVETTINGLSEIQNKRSELLTKLKNITKDNPSALEIITELEAGNKLENFLNEIKERVTKVNEDSFKITMSLQVQDITAQQLAAVNHLIESVNLKLSNLVEQINSSNIQEELSGLTSNVTEITPDEEGSVSFDKNAKYDHDVSRQERADELVNKKEQATQDDIDKLFA